LDNVEKVEYTGFQWLLNLFYYMGILEIYESSYHVFADDILTIAKNAREAGLKIKDSLHVACAIIANCKYLLTTDKRLLKYKDDRIKVINPIAFILEMEEF